MAGTPDPVEGLSANGPSAVSKRSFFIAGMVVDVLGLDEVPAGCSRVSVLWLLHPRLGSKERMLPVGYRVIGAWNETLQRQSAADAAASATGLIAVAFDQRNHGTRLLNSQANEAWRSGNPRHAQDMFSIYQGTADDTSNLLDYLHAYIYPSNEKALGDHFAMGVSLGGHATWHLLVNEPRISAGVVVIGCPDYVRVMTDRAAKSKLPTWTSTDPPGATFLGSPDFPQALLDAVDAYDPAGCLMGRMIPRGNDDVEREPSADEIKRLVPLMKAKLGGKSICLLSGGADKLVPYRAGVPFLKWLRKAIEPGGWFADGNVRLADNVYEGVGHEMTAEMLEHAAGFIVGQMHRGRAGESKI